MKDEKSIQHMPRIIWFQLFLLALGYAFYSANRLAFGVGLKSVAAQLALSAVEIGTLGTIFTLGQAFIDIPAGYIADRLGRKRMLVLGMSGIAITTMLVTTSMSFLSAAFWRFVFGMSEGIWNIVMYSVAGSIYPAARAMLNGLMMSFYSVGAYAGPAYYGWTLQANSGNWKAGLLAMGATTLAFALFLLWGFKTRYTDQAKDVKQTHLLTALHTVGTNRIVLLGIVIQILNIIPYWGFASMGPYLFMTYKGYSAAAAGSFFGTVYGIGGLSSVILGYFADRFGRKPVILFLSALNTFCAVLIFHFISQDSPLLLYIVAGMMGIGLHAIYVFAYTIGQDGVSPGQIGLATGIIGASSYCLSFFSGPLMGYLTDTCGYLTALDIVVVAFEAVLVVIALLMPETRKKTALPATNAQPVAQQ